MRFFINSGVCERKWNGNVKIRELESSMLTLSIPNYLVQKRKSEFIDFIIPGVTEKNLEKDCLLKISSLMQEGRKTYNLCSEEKEEEQYMYALLRNASCVKDDIFIPADMKDKVKVIKRIRFLDDEVDYGGYLSNVYFIRIKLEVGETLPVYLAYDNPKVLDKHYVFSRIPWCNEEYYVSKKLETYIILNDKNKNEYISLSTLC